MPELVLGEITVVPVEDLYAGQPGALDVLIRAQDQGMRQVDDAVVTITVTGATVTGVEGEGTCELDGAAVRCGPVDLGEGVGRFEPTMQVQVDDGAVLVVVTIVVDAPGFAPLTSLHPIDTVEP